MGVNKVLDFQASISDVKQVNPLFSTCKVRVLYTGKNRNMSIITKDAVEKALPTLQNIPIVGEFSIDTKDYKGHGGAIDLDSYDFVHTTKPYGVVPESATYEWETVGGREYLTIHGCYLWTGRYEEAYSVVEKGKGQSMEIEVTNGRWVEEEEAYQIDNFIFSALCILGDDVEPAFEEANITTYSLDKDSFKREFTEMLVDLKTSLSQEKEDETMLKQLLEKYSITMEDLTAKGIDLSSISEDELESKIVEAFEIDKGEPEDEPKDEPKEDDLVDPEPKADEPKEEPKADEPEINEEFEAMKNRVAELEGQLEELESLRQFKLDIEKAEHQSKVEKLFKDFQLTEEDVKDIEIHEFSVEEIEDKCFSIVGRKLVAKKQFSKDKEDGNVRLPINVLGDNDNSNDGSSYEEWLANLNKK